MTTLLKLTLFFSLISVYDKTYCQTTLVDTIVKKGDTLLLVPYIVPRHNSRSTLPDYVRVIGKLVDRIDTGICGYSCGGGVIKVQLLKPIRGYNHPFIFLVTVCISDKVKVGNEVNVIATKLRIKEKNCYYRNVMNTFDTGGIPLYKLSQIETSKLK